MRIPVVLLWILSLVLAAEPKAAEVPPRSPEAFDAAYEAIRSRKDAGSERDRFRRLVDLWWRQQVVGDPEFGTYVGSTEGQGQWTDLSFEALSRRRQELRVAQRVLGTIDRNQLPEGEQLYFDLFARTLRLSVEGERFPDELLPISQLMGPQQGLAQTLSQMPTATREDLDRIVERLQRMGPRVDAVVTLLREGLRRGITQPAYPLRDVPRQILDNIPDDPRQSPLFRPLVSESPTVSPGDRAAVQAAALSALTNTAYPAFRRLHRFVVDDYLPGARTHWASTRLPDGEAWYAFRARFHTTTGLTPDQIHELGLSEVRRIRGEMDKVIRESGFTGSFAEFLTFLRTDPRFYYDTGPKLLAGYQEICRRVDRELPRLFGRLPRLPYGVKAIPTYQERAQTTAYYQPGALTLGRPGVFFANTYALDMRPKWEMEALTLHEAVPGHHLQMALAQEIADMPEFQKHADTGAFIEGWALYAESLGPDLGLYRDVYSRFGQLAYEMWRAVRLVVDTGIHSRGWSRQQAIDFFLSNSGKTPHDVEVEVDRYIVWPGQALAYKVGELRIRELRRHAETTLGSGFVLREFHDELLGRGALPLDLLEPRMKSWVERKSRGGR
ncbi:MAG: hypothetical protein RLZ45_14 [Verrucomicrobiota bacterium]|jgi:uncharacterized protein (DUF885 family)